MKYFSHCLKCDRIREFLKSAFEGLAGKGLTRRLEDELRDGQNEVVHATLEFLDGCPDCLGKKGQGTARLVIGKRKKTAKH